jgi:hypothetical protein
MQTAEPLVLLRVPMDGRAASFRLQSGPEAGISWIKFAVIVIVRLDWATSASSPATSASFTKGHFNATMDHQSCPSIGFARALGADPTYPIQRDETNFFADFSFAKRRRFAAAGKPSRRRLAQPFGAAV